MIGLLLRCYPRAWRRRYGDELLDLLHARPVTAATVLDLARGAVRAHLDGPVDPAGRLRRAAVTALAGWLAFGAAAGAVAKSTEGASGGAGHPARLVAAACLGLATVAVVVGAAPAAVSALRQVAARRDHVGAGLLAVPALSAALAVGSVPLLTRVAGGVLAATVWAALLVAAGVGSLLAVTALVCRTDLPAAAMRWAARAGVVAGGAMTLGVLAGIAYGVGSRHRFGPHAGLLSTPLAVTWVPALLLAVAAAAMVDRAAVRALHALRTVG